MFAGATILLIEIPRRSFNFQITFPENRTPMVRLGCQNSQEPTQRCQTTDKREREFGNETRPGSMSIFITANLNTFGFSCLSAARIELEGGTTFVEILLCPIDWSDSIRGWCVITFRRIAAGFSSVLGLLKEQRPRNKSGEKLVS